MVEDIDCALRDDVRREGIRIDDAREDRLETRMTTWPNHSLSWVRRRQTIENA